MIVRAATAADASRLAALIEADGGGPTMVVDDIERRLADRPALIAEEGGGLVGYLVHEPAAGTDREDGTTEILALAAHPPGHGVGRALVEALGGLGPLVVVTTNDNLDALAFHQRFGFRIVAVRPGAVDRSRLVKPTIPTVGERGIPLHDELVLCRRRIES